MKEQENAIEYLIGIQRHYLIKRYGFDFENKIKKKNIDEFYDFIEQGLNNKIDLTQDEKYELEAKLKGLLLETKFLNTKYESPEEWFILSSLIDKIKKIFPTDTKFPYFGTILSGDINAEAYSNKDTSIKLILLEGELFTCANLLCKVIAQSIPLTDNDSFSFSVCKIKLDEHIKNEKTTEKFNDFFYNSTNNYPGKSEQYFLEKDSIEHLSSIFLDSLECFVVGHEYGHIYFNHFDSAILKKESLSDTNEDLLKIYTNWEQEFQADNLGAQVIIALDESGQKFPFSVLGPDLLFNFFHYKNIFEKKNIGDKRQDSDTHPAPLERKKIVREYILSRYSDKDKEILKLSYQLIDEIFNYHIDNYKRYLDAKVNKTIL